MNPQLAVSACLFDAQGRILLVQRRNAPYAGRWSLPGGRVVGGETLVEAVTREVREETGIALASPRFLDYRETIAEGRHFVIMVFCETVRQSPRAGDDALQAAFVDLSALAALGEQEGVTPGLPEIVTMAQQSREGIAGALASTVRRGPCSDA